MENNGTIIKNVEIKASPLKVWEALTKPELTKQYFFDCESISDYKVGSSISFIMHKDGKDIVCVKGNITVSLENKMLAYTCFSPQTENDPDKHTMVTMALIPEKYNTRLTVTQGSFKEDIERYNQSNEGWNYVIAGLKKMLESS